MEWKSIEELVGCLSEKIDALIEERNALRREVERLSSYAAERDEECVRVRQEMTRTVESATEESMRASRGGAEIESKLQTLNDRLIELVAERQRG